MLAVLSVHAAQLHAVVVLWDGGASSSNYGDDANWSDPGSGEAVPTSADDVTFNVSTNLRGSTPQIVDVGPVSPAKTVTVDLAAWAVRPTGNNHSLDISDSLTFTSNFTGAGAFTTFADAGGSNLRLRVGNNFSLTNNGSGTVSFGDGTNSDFGIAAIGASANSVLLDGSGDFLWNNGSVFAGVQRFGATDTFSGTFTLNGGAFNMGVDFRVAGGTVDVNADDLFGNGTALTFNDGTGPVDASVDFSGVSDDLGDLRGFLNGGILVVDALTQLVFGDYNEGPVDITGFAAGNTVIQFDGVAGTESLGNLTVNGGPAAWSDIGGDVYQLVPEPGAFALGAGLVALGGVFRRRRA